MLVGNEVQNSPVIIIGRIKNSADFFQLAMFFDLLLKILYCTICNEYGITYIFSKFILKRIHTVG